SVRAAIGAGRARVVRLFLTESLVLGAAGGAVGVALSYALVRAVVRFAPAGFPRVDEVAIDGAVLSFALVVTAAATLLAGLVPAFRASRADATSSLGGSGRARSARRSSRLTTGLVSAEVTLSVVVVIGSGLMVRS